MSSTFDALPIASTILQFTGKVAEGRAANVSARFTADQLLLSAQQSEAASERAAAEEIRNAELAQSRLRALSGGGSTDPTIVRLSQDIAGEGEYRALSALYLGSEKAAGLRQAADAKHYEGSQAQVAGWMQGSSTILRATPTLREKYGGKGPKSFGSNLDTFYGGSGRSGD